MEEKRAGFFFQISNDGLLRVSLAAGGDPTLKPGDTVRLPRLVVGAYQGAWATALTTLLQRPKDNSRSMASRSRYLLCLFQVTPQLKSPCPSPE